MRALKDRSGATAIEYTLIAGLIALAIILGLTAIPGFINRAMTTVASTLGGGRLMAHDLLAAGLGAFALLVTVAALRDVSSYTIPNWISLAALAVFAPTALAAGLSWPQLALALGVGAGALALGVAMFALGWIGGGDAKLFAACGLWLGWSGVLPFAMVTAVAGGALAVGLLLARRLSPWLPARAPAWLRRLATPGENVPYGVAIAVGALATFPASPLVAASALR